VNAYLYHRRWARKYFFAGMVPSAASGWLAIRGEWLLAATCFALGFFLGWLAGIHSTKAEKSL
jgi:hypothetical protein